MAYRLFKCSIPSCKYLFNDGHAAYFNQGRYATQDEDEVAELEAAIKARHPHIFVDPKESETDSAIADPMSALKKKIIEDYLKNEVKDRDLGTSDSTAGPGAGMLTSTSAAAITPESLGSKIKAGALSK